MALQWGHDLAVMERTRLRSTMRNSHALQWGHDLAVMESGVMFSAPTRQSAASMGP